MKRNLFIALGALVLAALLSVLASASEPLVFAFAKTTASDPKPVWNVVGSGCSVEEPGAQDGKVRCAYEEPGDEPNPSLPPMDTWHAPVSILD